MSSLVIGVVMIVPILGWIAAPALAWTTWATLFDDMRDDESTVSSHAAAA